MTAHHDAPDRAERQRLNDAADYVGSLVAQDTPHLESWLAFVSPSHGYVSGTRACCARLPTASTALSGITFAGQSLPIRYARAFGIIPSQGMSVHVTLAETFAAILNARGDIGETVRALLGAVPWKNASYVGRVAILFRLAVEHRRGFALPLLSMDQIAAGAAPPSRPDHELERRFDALQRGAKFKLHNRDRLNPPPATRGDSA